MVGFDGPAYDDDYIGIGPVGDRYTEFTWTRDGNPVSLQLPDVAGEYEIRYYLGQGEVILATVPFTVTKP